MNLSKTMDLFKNKNGSKAMTLTFEHNSEIVEFDVLFSKRKTLGIEVRPPGVVKVTAPIGTGKERILSAVTEKGSWIIAKRIQMKAMAELQPPTQSYEHGAIVVYLGKPYRLAIYEDIRYDIPHVEVKEGELRVYSASRHEKLIENAIEKWLIQMTKIHLEQRIQHFQKFFKVQPSRVIVKEQKRRWGSCNSKRELRFNKACIRVSERALDYLVVHEMSHLVHMNHSKAFWDQVEAVMPDYKLGREELKRTLI